MNILINGICGYMGREVAKLCEGGYRGARLAMGVDPGVNTEEGSVYRSFDEITSASDIDCIVDFSHHTATRGLLAFAAENKIPTVIATTGHTEDERAEIVRTGEDIPIFYSANMSLGVALLVELAKSAAMAMPEADIEIIEKHHNRKVDAPSGTALMIANELMTVREGAYTKCGRAGQGKRAPEEIGIHSLRLGGVVGEHEVIVATQNQTITIKHEAHSRALFAEGALAAASFIIGCTPGVYDMHSLVKSESKKSEVL